MGKAAMDGDGVNGDGLAERARAARAAGELSWRAIAKGLGVGVDDLRCAMDAVVTDAECLEAVAAHGELRAAARALGCSVGRVREAKGTKARGHEGAKGRFVATVGELAEALGVHRTTVSDWPAKAGEPIPREADGSFDVERVRRWRAERIGEARTETLGDRAGALFGSGETTERRSDAPGATQGTAEIDEIALRKRRADLEAKEQTARKLKIENDEREGRLVRSEAVVADLAARAEALRVTLERLADRLPAELEGRDAVGARGVLRRAFADALREYVGVDLAGVDVGFVLEATERRSDGATKGVAA